MTFAGVNYLAVLLAAVASFMLGWLWYGVLFKSQWMAAVGKSEEECKEQSAAPQMVITFVAQLIMALMLAGIIGHLGASGYTMWNGVVSGAAVWFGFVITTMVVNHGFGGARPMLTVIDGSHWLAVLAVQGAILGILGN